MSYRDDREALRGRVETLETDLAEAHTKIARLQGEMPAAEAKPRSFFAAPTPLELDRELPGELTDEGFEAIATLLHARLPRGQVSQVGRTLTHRNSEREFRIDPTDGPGVRLRLTRKFAEFRMLIPLVAFFIAPMPMALVLRALGPTFPGLLALPLIALGSWAASRALLDLAVKGERRKLRGLFESASDVASKHVVRVRVEERAGADQELEEEAEAEREAD